MNKEKIYDEQISPLMSQVIDICKKNNIAMLMTFSIPTEDDPDLACTTAILDDESKPTESMVKAYNIIMGRASGGMMITTRRQDGSISGMTAVI